MNLSDAQRKGHEMNLMHNARVKCTYSLVSFCFIMALGNVSDIYIIILHVRVFVQVMPVCPSGAFCPSVHHLFVRIIEHVDGRWS